MQDLTFYLTNSIVSPASSSTLINLHREMIKKTTPFVPMLIESLDIKPWMIFAPIASDWKEYNAGDWRGEIVARPNL